MYWMSPSGQPLPDLVHQFTYIHGAEEDHLKAAAAQAFFDDISPAGDDPDGRLSRPAASASTSAAGVIALRDIGQEEVWRAGG